MDQVFVMSLSRAIKKKANTFMILLMSSSDFEMQKKGRSVNVPAISAPFWKAKVDGTDPVCFLLQMYFQCFQNRLIYSETISPHI